MTREQSPDVTQENGRNTFRNGQKKVLICGDRDWTDVGLMRLLVRRLSDLGYDVVIHGDARGADRIAGICAKDIGMMVIPVPARWEEHGRSAGPRRNLAMLKLNPDLVVAVHSMIVNSKGTKHMVEAANKAGVPTILIAVHADLLKVK